MSDLLTPSESQQFHTFLSAMDFNDSNDARNVTNVDWTTYNSDGHAQSIPDVPHIQGREALAKATKDLMSLDAEGWNSVPVMHQYQQQQQQQQSYNFMNQQSTRYGYVMHDDRQSDLYQQNDAFPLIPKQSSKSPHPSFPHSHSAPSHPINHGNLSQSLSVSPSHTLGTSQDPRSGSSMRSSFSSMGSPPTTASSSTFSVNNPSHHEVVGNANHHPSAPSAESLPHSGLSDANGFHKRPLDASPYSSSNKRSRPSPPAVQSLPTKATLLSPSQKKANHIQSEQKRRANIRRGYEALCETVPALREAIRAEEEAQMTSDPNGSGKKLKRGRRAKIDDGTGEKIDGRAGPRSENIVLGKTIDYIKELLHDRQDLLARLERARASLAPDHPSGKPSDPHPLWEREWKGGSGKEGEAEEDEEDEE
ncbi:hypothetical protein C8R42DRAFT_646482 [Lentinula raphanica]|nr:hypothetical protein C8R42DRAFT_646482 [Lentinula raphanica]